MPVPPLRQLPALVLAVLATSLWLPDAGAQTPSRDGEPQEARTRDGATERSDSAAQPAGEADRRRATGQGDRFVYEAAPGMSRQQAPAPEQVNPEARTQGDAPPAQRPAPPRGKH